MLELLYFPEEYKFAIYLPLFLPLTYPLIPGFKKELGLCRKVQRGEDVPMEAEDELAEMSQNGKVKTD